jgi:hypothetical protein
MGKKRFTLFMILAIALMIAIFFHKNKEKIIPSHEIEPNREIEKIGEIVGPELQLLDLAPNDANRTYDSLERNRIIRHDKKVIQEKNIELMIGPHDDFYKSIKANDGDVKKTIKDIDPLKPPVKAEVKINF